MKKHSIKKVNKNKNLKVKAIKNKGCHICVAADN